MYTLAKSIIKARARQCQRVLQVVLDLVGKLWEKLDSRDILITYCITGKGKLENLVRFLPCKRLVVLKFGKMEEMGAICIRGGRMWGYPEV